MQYAYQLGRWRLRLYMIKGETWWNWKTQSPGRANLQMTPGTNQGLGPPSRHHPFIGSFQRLFNAPSLTSDYGRYNQTPVTFSEHLKRRLSLVACQFSASMIIESLNAYAHSALVMFTRQARASFPSLKTGDLGPNNGNGERNGGKTLDGRQGWMLSCSNLFILENSCSRPSWCAACSTFPAALAPSTVYLCRATCWAGPLSHNHLACSYRRCGKVHKQPRSTLGDASKWWRPDRELCLTPCCHSSRRRANLWVSAGELQQIMGAHRQRLGRNLQRGYFWWIGWTWTSSCRNYMVNLCDCQNAENDTTSKKKIYKQACMYRDIERGTKVSGSLR